MYDFHVVRPLSITLLTLLKIIYAISVYLTQFYSKLFPYSGARLNWASSMYFTSTWPNRVCRVSIIDYYSLQLCGKSANFPALLLTRLFLRHAMQTLISYALFPVFRYRSLLSLPSDLHSFLFLLIYEFLKSNPEHCLIIGGLFQNRLFLRLHEEEALFFLSLEYFFVSDEIMNKANYLEMEYEIKL